MFYSWLRSNYLQQPFAGQRRAATVRLGNEGEIINDKDLDCFGASLRDFSAASLQLFCCSASPGCELFGPASELSHPVESKPSPNRSNAWRSVAECPFNTKLRDHARSNL